MCRLQWRFFKLSGTEQQKDTSSSILVWVGDSGDNSGVQRIKKPGLESGDGNDLEIPVRGGTQKGKAV